MTIKKPNIVTPTAEQPEKILFKLEEEVEDLPKDFEKQIIALEFKIEKGQVS